MNFVSRRSCFAKSNIIWSANPLESEMNLEREGRDKEIGSNGCVIMIRRDGLLQSESLLVPKWTSFTLIPFSSPSPNIFKEESFGIR